MKRWLGLTIIAVVVGASSWSLVDAVSDNQDELASARTAIVVGCQQLNDAIENSQSGPAAKSTAMLVEEILDAHATPRERRRYKRLAAKAAEQLLARKPCKRVAAEAYAE